jgi:hypothetical protein
MTSNRNASDLFAGISKSVGRVKYHQGAKIACLTDGSLVESVAVRQASLRAAAPMMTIPLHPRGVKEAAQSSGRSEDQQANRAHRRTPPRTSVTKSISCFHI